ncbi:hypothetical protein CBR_g49799 [Chara braunii]|uniref:Retrotransposon gag domain-containing protein n=1 Tax=Chara braunii TaxID=69332 RepID=A0A388JNZ9_CHABU|nr:hypothetical protein CBR_g49799 [Chara braunii]|eukprot:GBG59539.1 hypothetical protein CBR_g49799 [Chara braunii]
MDQKSGETDEAYQARMLLLITEAKQWSDAVAAATKKKAEDAKKAHLLAIEQQRQQVEAAAKAADEERVQRREKIFSRERALLTMAADCRAEAENGNLEESGNKIALLLGHLRDLLATCITQEEDIHSLDDALSQVHSRLHRLEQRPVAAPIASCSNTSDRLEALEIDVGSLKDSVQLQQTATQQLEQRICTAANHSSSEPRETTPKFDGQEIFCNSMKTDPIPWFRKFEITLQLHYVKEHKHHGYLYSRSGGACQAWLDNLLSKHGVVAADLHTKISWDDLKAAWHKRFQVEPPEIKAMDKLMVFEQGTLPSVDWIAEYQRLTSVPDIQKGFKAIKHYFISRSCPAGLPVEKQRQIGKLSTAGSDSTTLSTPSELVASWVAALRSKAHAEVDSPPLLYSFEDYAARLVPTLGTHAQGQDVCAASSPSGSDDLSSSSGSLRDSAREFNIQVLDPLTSEDFAWFPLPTTGCLPGPQCAALCAHLHTYLSFYAPPTSPMDDEVAVGDILAYVTKVAREFRNQRYDDNNAPLLYVRIQVGQASCNTLLDSGASRNFISQAFTQKAGLGAQVRRKANPTTIKLADGRTQQLIDRYIEAVPVYFAPHACEPITFDILDTDFHIILGMSWLASADHTVNFHRWTLTVRDAFGAEVPCTIPLPHPSIRCQVVTAKSFRATCAYEQPDKIGLCFLWTVAVADSLPMDLSSDPRVVRLLDEFADIFESPTGVVPDRPISHEIILEPGAVPPKGCICRMSEEELTVLRTQLDDLMNKGWIRPSSSHMERQFSSYGRRTRIYDCASTSRALLVVRPSRRRHTLLRVMRGLPTLQILQPSSVRRVATITGPLVLEGSDYHEHYRAVPQAQDRCGWDSYGGRPTHKVRHVFLPCRYHAKAPELAENGRNDGVVSADGEVLPVEVRAPNCEGVNHGEEFFLVGGVIHPRGKELLACEGDGVFVGWSLGVSGRVLDGGGLGGFVGEMLGQYGSNGEVGGISGDIEMASGVGDLEDRGRGDGLLEEVKRVLAAIVPIEGIVLACEFVERGSIRMGFSGDNVAKVFDARSGKRTFAELGVEFLLSEDREDLANVLRVGLKGGAKDEDVIKVHDDTDFEEVTEDVVHGGLECGGGIGESERHYEELVVPEPRVECGLVGVLLADTDLVEATVEVDLGEIFGSTEAIKKLRYPGEWVLVLNRDPVQGTVVCAHEEFRGVVLLDEEATGSEGGGARLNESFFKEFIELFSLGD